MKKRKQIVVSNEWHKRIEEIAERRTKELGRYVTMTEITHEAYKMYTDYINAKEAYKAVKS